MLSFKNDDINDSLDKAIQNIFRILSDDHESISKDAAQMVLEEFVGYNYALETESINIDNDLEWINKSSLSSYSPDLRVNEKQLRQILMRYRPCEDGRRFAVISLAEAETLRRIIHVRGEQAIIDGWNTEIALHSISHGGMLMEKSHEYFGGPPYQTSLVVQAARFFDGAMKFQTTEQLQLLRMIQLNSTQSRQDVFVCMASCRRRYSRKWQDHSIANVLQGFNNEFNMLRHAVEGRLLRYAIKSHSDLADELYAFEVFDTSGDKCLQPDKCLLE